MNGLSALILSGLRDLPEPFAGPAANMPSLPPAEILEFPEPSLGPASIPMPSPIQIAPSPIIAGYQWSTPPPQPSFWSSLVPNFNTFTTPSAPVVQSSAANSLWNFLSPPKPAAQPVQVSYTSPRVPVSVQPIGPQQRRGGDSFASGVTAITSAVASIFAPIFAAKAQAAQMRATNPRIPPMPQQAPTNWGTIALVGGGILAVVVLGVVLTRRSQ